MNKKLKVKWVKALRSGKFKQGQGALYDEDGYCCLGVLCKVVGAQGRCNSYGAKIFTYKGTREGCYLPEALAKEARISTRSQQTLAKKNDRDNWSFGRIANYIEKRL